MTMHLSHESEFHKKLLALINNNKISGSEFKNFSEGVLKSQDALEKKIDLILNAQENPGCPASEECISILSVIFQLALIYTSCMNQSGQICSKEIKAYKESNNYIVACKHLSNNEHLEDDFKTCCTPQIKKCTPEVVAEKINFILILMFKVIGTYQQDKN